MVCDGAAFCLVVLTSFFGGAVFGSFLDGVPFFPIGEAQHSRRGLHKRCGEI